MDIDLDDLLPGPVGGRVRAGVKFKPKAKPQPKNEKHVKELPTPPIVTKEQPDTKFTAVQQTSDSVPPIDTPIAIPGTGGAISTDHSPKSVVIEENVNRKETLDPGFSQPDGDNNFSLVPRPFMSDNVDSSGLLNSKDTNCTIHEDLQTYSARSGKETADIFSSLESLDDILPEDATVNGVRKFQPILKECANPRNELPTTCPVNIDTHGSVSHTGASILLGSTASDVEEMPSLPALSSVGSSTLKPGSGVTETSEELLVSQEPANIRGTGPSESDRENLDDNRKSEREEPETYCVLDSFDVVSQATTTVAGDTEFTESENDGGLASELLSGGSLDFSSKRITDSSPSEPPSKLAVTGETTNCADALGSSGALPVRAEDSQPSPVNSGKESMKTRKRKTSSVSKDKAKKVQFRNVEELSQGALDDRPVPKADGGIGLRRSSRQLKKRFAVPVRDAGIEDGAAESGDQPEPSNYSLIDEDDNDSEYREEASDSIETDKATKATQSGKKGRKRKSSSDGPTTTSNREPPKKKFSHSTRRNKRQVNKVLLEMPEEEIDHQKLIIKDLILLAETKERIMKKNAAASKESLPNQSVDNSSAQDGTFGRDDSFDDPFASMHGLNPDDEETRTVHHSGPIHNYHSYMDKLPRTRWSKQDTELFYEAIRQFGTDFAMIQQLFPGRTRHQVKLKYKKEERQNPLMLSDALTNRSKDHSHFDLVLEKLRQEAEAEKDSDRDVDSVGVSGDADTAQDTHEEIDKSEQHEEVDKSEEAEKSEQKEEAEKSEQKEEGENAMETAEVLQAHDFVKSPHETDDKDYKWSQYETDYDDYVGF